MSRIITACTLTASALCLLGPTIVHANNWFGGIHMGVGGARIGKDQGLTQFVTSSPVVTNAYDAHRETQPTALIGFDGGYQYDCYGDWQPGLSLTAEYLKLDSVKGTVHPLVNVAPDFDTLDFYYNVESYILGVEPSLTYRTYYSWDPFVSFMLGVGFNRVYNYTETASATSTASPSTLSFSSKTLAAFAFAPKLGVEHRINDHALLRIGVAYMNLGHAKFGPLPTQETNQTLRSGRLSTYMATVDVMFN